MKKKQTKKLILMKETLNGLERLVQGGTQIITQRSCFFPCTDPYSEGIYDNPQSCATW